MELADLNDAGRWRVPAGCLGEMGRRGLTVAPSTRVLDLEQIFLGDPQLGSVIILDSRGEPACVTRAAFFAALAGHLGFGRALYTRHPVRDMPRPSTLLLAAETTIFDAVRAVLERPAESRYDDLAVAYPDGGFGTMCVADLFAELAHTHEFEGLHDALTGLANRRLLLRRLRASEGLAPAVLFVDVDDFKRINDGLGHDVGNEVLSVIAGRLTAVAGPEATVARVGGDEFAVLFPGVAGAEEAEVLAAQVVSALSAPLRTGSARAVLSASVGVALAAGGESAEDLLRNADLAMYAAKRGGKSAYAFYEPGMHEAARGQLELRSDLEGALGRGEMYLDYQPIVALADRRVIGVEALLRWRRRDGTVVAPGDFIELCEQSGLIIPIGRWVLAEASRQAAEWADERPGMPPLRVSVNVSPRQLLFPGLADDVAAALRESGLAPEALTLEITEGVFIRDAELVLQRLAECRELGVRVALDDFGAGFSSLSRLAQMPIDVLKLDRSFVAQLATKQERDLVAGIIALAESLDLVTVGEGVETEDQAIALREMGCQLSQGFHHARPMPPEAIPAGLAVAVRKSTIRARP